MKGEDNPITCEPKKDNEIWNQIVLGEESRKIYIIVGRKSVFIDEDKMSQEAIGHALEPFPTAGSAYIPAMKIVSKDNPQTTYQTAKTYYLLSDYPDIGLVVVKQKEPLVFNQHIDKILLPIIPEELVFIKYNHKK